MSHFQQKSRFISTLALLSFLPACVTTHATTPVPLAVAPVKVSCSYGADIQTNSISGIVCTLENQSRNWQDLKIRSVRFPDQADVKVVPADDMQALADAMAVQQKRSDHNTAMALSGLILTGALVAVGASGKAASNAGTAVMLGGTTAAVGRDIHKSHQSAQYGPAVYSRDHLLSGALRIPSEMSIRRQIVINHPSKKPQSMEICWIASKDECSILPL
ncbi:hypothetical protein [Oligoflexus tunisiensis]|uniref:hypothetical protein n=1 Tax=Oligoflexus tunisiensis TaxID=708132 RepID=UPI00114CE19B|nr:hypothetical protein [Oligoflexus tunisiensis]